MADIEDELLALAGGSESSDEGEEMEEASESGSEARRSPTPPPVKKERSPAPKAAKAKAQPKPKRRAAKEDDSEEEEGEASSAPSTPNSLESAPMDESDSDAEPGPRGGLEEKYPVEGIYISLAEKEEISRLPELQRETILADRIQESELNRQNMLLRQLVNNQMNEERRQQLKSKKRTAGDADLEAGDSQRKSARSRTRLDGTKVGETSAGIDSLRKARAEKNDRQRRREEAQKEGAKHSPNARRDDHTGADEDDDDWMNERPKSRTPEREITARELPPAELGDFERVRVGRRQFAEKCFDPGFEETVTGCYVRVAGERESSGENKYHMALIKGLAKGRPYAMAGPGGVFVTDQYVVAAIGKSTREIPFIFCSDSPITETELHRYKMFFQQYGGAIPKKALLDNKVDDIHTFLKRSLTDQEVSAKIERKRELRKPFDPIVREGLRRDIEDAKARGRPEEVIAELEEQYDEMLKLRLAHGTSLKASSDMSSKAPSQQERLAALNLANRRHNAEAVRRAQIQEKKHIREMEEKIARGEAVTDDMSRRLKTKTKFVFNPGEGSSDKKKMSATGSAAGSGASTPANGTPRLGAQKLLPHLAKLQEKQAGEKKGIPTIHKPLVDDDIIGALDLDIDVEI